MSQLTIKLPTYAQRLLTDCPSAGHGVHTWLFKVACALHPYIKNKAQIVKIIATATENCGRHVGQREIEDAVENSEDRAWVPGREQLDKSRRPTKWPSRNYEMIEAIARDGISLADLWASSPVSFCDNHSHTEEVIDELFPGDPLLCCGRTSWQFHTQKREAWRGVLNQLALIVPSPMTTPVGRTKTGKVSEHCLDNTGSRRFLGVEFDFKEKDADANDTPDAPLLRSLAAYKIEVGDLCAALHAHLAQLAPLVCAVHSGGKSLHGWYFAEGQPENKLHKFMRYAVSIGADPMTWTKSQFIRMPGGLRDNRKRQAIYYFDPSLLL